MKGLRFTLTLILLAGLGLALLAALNWQRLLSPEQKLRYGLVFSAAEDLRQQAAARPSDLDSYAAALLLAGNLGRAQYLAELYGADCPGLDGLRTEIEAALQAARENRFHSVSASSAAAAYSGKPLLQALYFLDGYQHALLGDWASARNFFARLDVQQLAPVLRPYATYYLARSYRLAGDSKQKAEVEKLLLSVLDRKPGPDLTAKSRYNLIAYYLSPAYTGRQPGIALARDQELLLGSSHESWAVQKAYTDIGRHYLEEGSLAEAWPRAVAAVQLDVDTESSAGAAALCLDILRGAADGKLAGGRSADGSVALELPTGLLTALARSSINRGDSVDCRSVLDGLAGRIKDRARWEELKVAQALCLRKSADLAGLRRLMAEATLAGFSDATTGRILFELASTEEDAQLWNDALEHYRGCARLGGSDAGRANYACYHILKRVQDPLNLESAVQYLQAALKSGPDDQAFGKTVEELLPLLVFRGQSKEARRLAEQAVAAAEQNEGRSDEELATAARLAALGRSWLAYLADRRSDRSEAATQRKLIPCRYWSYYELLNNYPPDPQLESTPGLLKQPETAGEYFAGLGLSTLGEEYFHGRGDNSNQLLLYCQLRNSAVTASQANLAYAATARLESGMVAETPLLDYLLDLAYPRAFDEQLLPAASRLKVDPALMYGIIKKESAFKTGNISDQGAEGLMQVMPDTASFLNNSYSLGIDMARRKDARNNLLLGAANLRMLFDQLGASNVRGVIAGHNKGAGNYQKWQRLYPADEVLFTELIPNEENESFSKLVWKYYKIYSWLDSRSAD